MVKRGQLSTETLRWLSDSWMLYIKLYSPGSWEAPLYTLSVHLFYEFTIQCPEAHSFVYKNQQAHMGVCSHWEMFEKYNCSPSLLTAGCYVLCLYTYVCDCVCVSVCARRAPAHIRQQTRGRLSSGSDSSVRNLLHLCGWMLARSLSSVGQKLYVCMFSSILSWSFLFSCGVFCGTCVAWSLCEWGI